MIRRTLLQQSRAICVRSSSIEGSQKSRTHHHPTRLPSLPTRTAPRYYSTVSEAAEGAKGEAVRDTSEEVHAKDADPISKELEAKNHEIIDLKVRASIPLLSYKTDAYPLQDRYLRSVADFRNLQDRTKRDVDSTRSFAIFRFASDLIESVDNLDRALKTVPAEKIGQPDSNKELTNLYEGLKMTDSILMQTLKKHGLERFDPSVEEEMFNPNLHEAIFQTKVEGKENGRVFMTQQTGFLLNGRVVRAAKVGVVKNS